MITEVEVYDGIDDKASHAWKGKTKRNTPMFGPPGYWYVYFCYGVHWMLNIVTREEGYPAAILIRGTSDVIGPGRLTKQFRITGALNGLLADESSGLWIEERGLVVPSSSIRKTPRIGVDYAGIHAKKLLRFSLK